MNDPIERLRAANPLPECPPPPIDEVWRRIDEADERTRDTTERSTARSVRGVGPHRIAASALLALSTVIVAGIVVAAILTLGHRQQHGASPGSPSTGAAESSRRQLLRSLTVLRRPQDRADRRALRGFGQGGLLPNYLSSQPLPLCGSLCDVKLQRGLARSFMIPGSRYRAAIFPVTTTSTTPAASRGQFAVVLSVDGPRMGNARSSAVSASSGTPAASGPVSISALQTSGVIVSFGLSGSAGINRAAILTPDGVSAVTLEDLKLTSPSTGRRVARLPAISAPVRDDIALFTLTGMTASHLHITRDPDGSNGGFHSGHDCAVTTIVYTVPATARMLWREAGTDHESTVHFYAYVNAHPTPGERFPSPRCGA